GAAKYFDRRGQRRALRSIVFFSSRLRAGAHEVARPRYSRFDLLAAFGDSRRAGGSGTALDVFGNAVVPAILWHHCLTGDRFGFGRRDTLDANPQGELRPARERARGGVAYVRSGFLENLSQSGLAVDGANHGHGRRAEIHVRIASHLEHYFARHFGDSHVVLARPRPGGSGLPGSSEHNGNFDHGSDARRGRHRAFVGSQGRCPSSVMPRRSRIEHRGWRIEEGNIEARLWRSSIIDPRTFLIL